jgi:hypothetical protein
MQTLTPARTGVILVKHCYLLARSVFALVRGKVCAERGFIIRVPSGVALVPCVAVLETSGYCRSLVLYITNPPAGLTLH